MKLPSLALLKHHDIFLCQSKIAFTQTHTTQFSNNVKLSKRVLIEFVAKTSLSLFILTRGVSPSRILSIFSFSIQIDNWCFAKSNFLFDCRRHVHIVGGCWLTDWKTKRVRQKVHCMTRLEKSLEVCRVLLLHSIVLQLVSWILFSNSWQDSW